jgi:putative hemolysin
MGLVEQKDIARIVQLDKLGLSALAKPIMKILRISDVNEVYKKFEELHGVAFIDAVLEEFEVTIDYYEEELKRIPKSGPFITVSNHPLGGIDGIILIKLISQIRPDYKVMANFLLQKVEPLKDFFMPVNPFDDKDLKSSFTGIKESIEHINAGHALGIFPAGEVSTYKIEAGKISDKEWDKSTLKMIKKMQVPVVPVYFKARNSSFFYLLSMLHPSLRSAKLPSELLTQKNKPIRIRIGKSLSVKEQKGYKKLDHYSAFLRQRTYLLRHALSPEKKLLLRKRPQEQEALINPIPVEALRKEIEFLNQTEALLLNQKNYNVYLTTSKRVPNLLNEIGRLREVTFRAVGEGTNLPLDLDEYDYHYHHLILWDKEKEELAGAYRLALGDEVFMQYGIKGFYTSTLFKIDKELHPLFKKSLEMGRAFIVKGHQQKPLPLFLLWKGIIQTMVRNPDLEYIIGNASISNRFSKFGKSLIVKYLLNNFGDEDMEKFIHPRKAFKPKLKGEYKRLLSEWGGDDINQFDRMVESFETQGLKIPVLIKKYLKQNAHIVCFNLDPLFNNSLDGFMYMHIKDLPEGTFDTLTR